MGNKSPDKIDVEVGQRIRVQRQTASLSQTALADGLGVTFQQVQKYEKGVNRVGAGRLTKIAHVLGVPIGALLGTDEDNMATREGPRGAATCRFRGSAHPPGFDIGRSHANQAPDTE